MAAGAVGIGRATYDEAVVVDGLNVSNWDSSAVYDSLGASGVSAINATLATWEGFQETLDAIAPWPARFQKYGTAVTPARSVDDIVSAKGDGKVGVIFGFQNASPIENRLDRLGLFHALGVRIIQLTYHERNLLGNGCYERRDYGVSNFGADAIREMNRLGILIDLSHVGDRTTMDTIEMSEKPVACTHANARSYCDRNRNKADEALKLPGRKGRRRRFHVHHYLPARGRRCHGGQLRQRHRLPGRDDRHRPRRHRDRLHPGPARVLLALHRLPGGHQVPGIVHPSGRQLPREGPLPQRPGDTGEAAGPGGCAGRTRLRGRGCKEGAGWELDETV